MKTIFIPAKSKTKLNKAKLLESSKTLPKNITIAYSIQFQEIAFEAKALLSNKHNITSIVQVLGCSKPKFSKSTQAILLIGSGRFHAVSLALEINLPIYILEQNNLYQISKKDLDLFEKKQKVSYMKFLHADKVGILVSTKPGQQNLKKALNLKNKIKNKSCYLFISNNLDSNEFENFGLDSWVNTACPRLDFDSSVVNIGEVEKN